ncbi:MAG: peptidyl-tRNA hydrolase [Candidatus Westeberhardia cardiocondylae]|nr:peptidyl-tRNA hydrolase [Candidatus Westeberhardia cardiocondylae]
MIKLIVGLGNPGIKYKYTRHNIGTWYIISLLKELKIKLKIDRNFCSYISKFKSKNENIIYFVIPNIFINLCGKIIKKISLLYKILPNEILIVHDDMDLYPGNIKLKFGSKHHGHNGVKNIIHSFENKTNFYQLKIGIGRPKKKEEIINFVLNRPPIQEKKLIDFSIKTAVKYTKTLIIKNNIEIIMNKLNKKNKKFNLS